MTTQRKPRTIAPKFRDMVGKYFMTADLEIITFVTVPGRSYLGQISLSKAAWRKAHKPLDVFPFSIFTPIQVELKKLE